MAAAVALVVMWTLVGFIPAVSSVSWLIWGSGAAALVALTALYTTTRMYEPILLLRGRIARIRLRQRAQNKKLFEATKRTEELQVALAGSARLNAELSRRVEQFEGGLQGPAVAPTVHTIRVVDQRSDHTVSADV